MSNARTQARRMAVQGLYEWQMTDNDVHMIISQFLQEHAEKKLDREYFEELMRAIPEHLAEIDAYLKPYLSRPLQEIDLVERAILRLATYELAYRPELPYRVIINEAVELAKRFGAEEGHRFINGILDKVAGKLRVTEIKMKKA